MKIKGTISGIHCKSCNMLIKEILGDEKGIKSFEIKDTKIEVDFDETVINIEKINQSLASDGYLIDGISEI